MKINRRSSKNETADSYIKSPKGSKILTAAVLLVVIAINILISAVADARLWYVDMTSERYKNGESALYTLSDTCRDLIGEQAVPMVEEINRDRAMRDEEDIKVKIIFCADKDRIEENRSMRYINMTARALQKEYPEAIEVEYVNILKNPSAVQRFKTTSASRIYDSDVIVEFGSEYLIQRVDSFYYTDDGETEAWAYNGEQKLSAMILSLTRAESPICAITNNHGETIFGESGEVKKEYSTFIELIGGAGYDVVYLDLEREEIPENCRMIITFDPQYDFKAYGSLGENGVSEIDKLDRYLEKANAFFYICNRETPVLPSLEEYLTEWGITVMRTDGEGDRKNYAIRDSINCTDTGKGDIVVGRYGEKGVSGGITATMRDQAYPPMVVFGNSTAVSPSESYLKMYVAEDSESNTPAYSYFSYYRNGVSRIMYDVFSSYDTASAYIDGELFEIATEYDPFELMTITKESRIVQETNYTSIDRSTYVYSLASTDFLRNEVLDSAAYGNADVILSTLRHSGVEAVPANVRLKAFYVYDIEDVKPQEEYVRERNTWLICLTVIPIALAFVGGVLVTVKRRAA